MFHVSYFLFHGYLCFEISSQISFCCIFFFLSKSKRPGKFLLRRIFREQNLDLNVKGITEEAMTRDFTISVLNLNFMHFISFQDDISLLTINLALIHFQYPPWSHSFIYANLYPYAMLRTIPWNPKNKIKTNSDTDLALRNWLCKWMVARSYIKIGLWPAACPRNQPLYLE